MCKQSTPIHYNYKKKVPLGIFFLVAVVYDNYNLCIYGKSYLRMPRHHVNYFSRKTQCIKHNQICLHICRLCVVGSSRPVNTIRILKILAKVVYMYLHINSKINEKCMQGIINLFFVCVNIRFKKGKATYI